MSSGLWVDAKTYYNNRLKRSRASQIASFLDIQVKSSDDEETEDSKFVGNVNIDNADKSTYLIKINKSIYDKLVEASNMSNSKQRRVIGHMRFNSNTKEPRLFLHDSEEDERCNVYNLKFFENKVPIIAFSEEIGSIRPHARVEGVVRYQGNAEPATIVSKKRQERVRNLILLEDDSRDLVDNNSMNQKNKKEKEKPAKIQREVMSEEEKGAIKLALFTAFENRLCYKAHELANEIDEPLHRLRTITKEVCDFNKTGAFANSYTIKKQFMSSLHREEYKKIVHMYDEKKSVKLLELRDKRIMDQSDRKRKRAKKN